MSGTCSATAPLTPTLQAELQGSASKDELQALFASAGIAQIGDEATVRGSGTLHSLSFGGRAWLLREDVDHATLEVLEEWESASAARDGDPRAATPFLTLTGTEPGSGPHEWEPRSDLLSSDGAHRAFVVEQEHDGSGTAALRRRRARSAADRRAPRSARRIASATASKGTSGARASPTS